MATRDETSQALLDAINELASTAAQGGPALSQMILNLSEAYAWVRMPGASHGGGGSTAAS